ncbi:MAG: hypothetical protein WCY09_08450 [Candidatus Omnitrophota bacterium]
MTDEIRVTDGGPIEGTFKIDLSDGPGAYEFRGARGTGKTTCISSIDWLAGHKVDVTLHDGAVSGKVEGFGVVAPIGGRKRRNGELGLDTIDAEKFSLTDLIDPPGKTPEVRDAHAIKALAVLSEATADEQLYYELAGGQKAFDQLGVQPTPDPVLLATRVKQAYDKQARDLQNTTEAESRHALPLEHVPDDLDVRQSADLAVLGHARDEARDTLQFLRSERSSGITKEAEIAQAKERLATIISEYRGLSIGEAANARDTTIDKGTRARALVDQLEKQLEQAKAAVETCKTEYVAANATYEASRSHQVAVEELQSIASQIASYPNESSIAEASHAVETATAAYDRGVRIRDVQQNQAKAKAHRDAAEDAERAANEARNKAGQVFDILAKSLHTKHLEIHSVDGNPRLFVQHPRRGKTAFDRVNGLSDGERVDFTLRELLPHIESPGLLPIPQRVWQDLQPSDRTALHALAVEKGLYLFGAQVDDGELRVVYLGETNDE